MTNIGRVSNHDYVNLLSGLVGTQTEWSRANLLSGLVDSST